MKTPLLVGRFVMGFAAIWIVCAVAANVIDRIYPMGWGHDNKRLSDLLTGLTVFAVLFAGNELAIRIIGRSR